MASILKIFISSMQNICDNKTFTVYSVAQIQQFLFYVKLYNVFSYKIFKDLHCDHYH